MSMRLVMEISGAHAAAGTTSGGQEKAARIVDGRKARKPIRRNGHKTEMVLGWDSVGQMRKFDSHDYGWALGARRSYLLGRWGPRLSRARSGRVRGGRLDQRESPKALPNTLFVGCAQGFNKRLMGIFVTNGPVY
jgi:hypothetical protein